MHDIRVLETSKVYDLNTLTADEIETLIDVITTEVKTVPRTTIESLIMLTVEEVEWNNHLKPIAMPELILRWLVLPGDFHVLLHTVQANAKPAQSGITVQFSSRVDAYNGQFINIAPNQEIRVVGVTVSRERPTCDVAEATAETTAEATNELSIVGAFEGCAQEYFGNAAFAATPSDTVTRYYTIAELPLVWYRLWSIKRFSALEKAASALIHRSKFDAKQYTPPVASGDVIAETNDVSAISDFIATSHHNYAAFVRDLYKLGIAEIFYNIRLSNDAVVKKLIKAYHAKLEKQRLLHAGEIENASREYRIGTILQLIYARFPAKWRQLIGFSGTTQAIVPYSRITALLTKAELASVITEYEKSERYHKAYLENKCPHIRLMKQYASAVGETVKSEYYKQLLAYMPVDRTNTSSSKSKQSMIMCSNCGFDLICPHAIIMNDLPPEIRFNEIMNRLNAFIDHDNTSGGNYFCKVCREALISVEEFGTPDENIRMDDELKNMIYGEIMSTMRYIEFDRVINPNTFINACRNTIYRYIAELEKQVMKSRTNTAHEIKAKKRLYIAIYAYAYIISLIVNGINATTTNDSGSSSSSKVRVMFKTTKPQNPKNILIDSIKFALETIIMTKNVVIRSIPNMTNDTIKNQLISAFKAVSGIDTGLQITARDSNIAIATNDAIFHYIVFMTVANSLLTTKKLPSDISSGKLLNIAATNKKKQAVDAIFAHYQKFAEWPQLKDFMDGKYGTSHVGDIMAGSSVVYRAYLGYMYRSFMLTMERVNGGYVSPVFVNGPTGSEFSELHAGYNQTLIDTKILERKLLQIFNLRKALPWYNIGVKNSRRWCNQGTKLGRIYDTEGRPHKYTILVLADTSKNVSSTLEAVSTETPSGRSTKQPNKQSKVNGAWLYKRGGDVQDTITVAELQKLIRDGVYFDRKIIDVKCSVCGVLKSAAADIDENKIKDALLRKNSIGNLYQFYALRCPAGGQHEMKGTTCAKCDKTNVQTITWYDRWFNTYKRELAESQAINVSPVVSQQPRKQVVVGDWAFTFNVIAELATAVGVNHRLLFNLGAIEKMNYDDVVSGTYIAPEVTERDNTRIYVIDTHIKNFIRAYNQFRNYDILVHPPIIITNIIEESGIGHHQIKEMFANFPQIYNDYSEKMEYFKWNRKPREIVEFELQTLCEMALTIINHKHQPTDAIRRAFVKTILGRILKGEEMNTKAGSFNWALLYGEREKAVEVQDSNFTLNANGEKSEFGADIDDAGDTNKPFSTNSIDVDEAFVDNDE